MTTTLTTLRGRLRIDLHDEDNANYRWEDATLNRHIERAVRDLALVAPRQQKDTLQTTASSREIDVSGLADLIEVEAIEYPAGQWPPEYAQFSLFAQVLTLQGDRLPAGVENVNIYWGSLHTVDGSGSTLPAGHEDLAVLGAAGYAAVEWASFASNRANLAGTVAFDEYARWGADALRRFADQLSRLREVSRVRAVSLFTPARPGPSRDIVNWES